jgi:hypothetical protein
MKKEREGDNNLPQLTQTQHRTTHKKEEKKQTTTPPGRRRSKNINQSNKAAVPSLIHITNRGDFDLAFDHLRSLILFDFLFFLDLAISFLRSLLFFGMFRLFTLRCERISMRKNFHSMLCVEK